MTKQNVDQDELKHLTISKNNNNKLILPKIYLKRDKNLNYIR